MATKRSIRTLSETEKQTLLHALSDGISRFDEDAKVMAEQPNSGTMTSLKAQFEKQAAGWRALYTALDESEVALKLLPE